MFENDSDTLSVYPMKQTSISQSKSPEHITIIHPHSWIGQIITCYPCFNDQISQTQSPYFQKMFIIMDENTQSVRDIQATMILEFKQIIIIYNNHHYKYEYTSN